MHMHCVFFNLVGAKSRRVPLLVPTSSLSLLQWPLLYKHVAEFSCPEPMSRTKLTTPPRRQSIISGVTTELLNCSAAISTSWHSELYDRAKEKDRPFVWWGTDVMERAKQTNDLHLWNSPFSTPAPKTFSSKAENFYYSFFLSLFSWKDTEKGLFCIHLYTRNSTSKSVIWPKAWQKENPQHH